MIALHDPEVAERLRRLRQHAMDRSALARHAARDVVIEHYPERGWNARMTDLQAAVGPAPARAFSTRSSPSAGGSPSATTAALGGASTWIETPARTRLRASAPGSPIRSGSAPAAPVDAAELMRALLRDGHRHPARGDGDPPRGRLRRLRRLRLPHTEAAARDVVLLPLFPGLRRRAQDYVDRAARRVVAEAAGGRLGRDVPVARLVAVATRRIVAAAKATARGGPTVGIVDASPTAESAIRLLDLIGAAVAAGRALAASAARRGDRQARLARVARSSGSAALGRDLEPFSVAKFRTMHEGVGADAHRTHVEQMISDADAAAARGR